MEVREFIGVFFGGIIALALFATAVQPNSQTAAIASALANGFKGDIQAATFQSGQ